MSMPVHLRLPDGTPVDSDNPLPIIGGGGGSGGGGGPVTVSNGADVTQGNTADAAWSGSGSGTVVAVLKAIWTRLRGGQSTMASSLPVAIASDQGALATTSAPPAEFFAITPSDSTTFTPPLRGIRNGGADPCTVVVDAQTTGTAIALHNVASGETLVGFFTKVRAATTGTDLVGLR